LVANAKAHDAKRLRTGFANPEDKAEASAFVGSFSGYEHNAFFVNTQVGVGAAGYVEAGFPAGLDFDHDGRAAAPIDIDGDGRLDLALLTLQGLKLLLNDPPPGVGGGFVRLRLRATRSEAHALGATVLVRAGTHRQLERVRLTAGFHTQLSPELHFGTAEAARVDEVEVRWPSGAVQRFADLEVGRRYLIIEGQPAPRAQPLPSWPKSARPRAGRDFALELVTPATGRPTVVNFWAPWCTACERELPALAKLNAEWADDVGLTGVTLPGEGADAFVERHGLRYPMVRANDAIMASFFGEGGEVTLPATFVFDARGRLSRSFFREIDAAELRASVAGLEVAPAAQDHVGLAISRSRAQAKGDALAAFREAVASGGDALTWWRLGVTALNGGDPEAAVTALRQAVRLNSEDAEAWTDLGQALTAAGKPKAAQEALLTATRIGAPAARAHHLLGARLAKRGEHSKAAARFEKALTDDPTQVVSWRGLARAQRALGLVEDAEDSLARYRAKTLEQRR